MRILISGGAGFVASHLADRWIADGHQVIAADNLITGRRANIAHLLKNPAFTYIEQDICEPLKVDGRLDCVFHMASPASPFDYLANPIETMLVMVTKSRPWGPNRGKNPAAWQAWVVCL